MNISTDKLINETNQLTYKLHIISLKNKDSVLIIISLQKTTLELKRTYSILKNCFAMTFDGIWTFRFSIWMRFHSSFAHSLT